MKLIKQFLFQRSTLLAVAILAQLLVLIGVISRFSDYFVIFYGLSILISIIVVLVIINNNMNPAYKLAWIIAILSFPIFGGLFYLLFGGKQLGKISKKRMKSISEDTQKLLTSQSLILEEIKSQSKTALNQSRYIRDYANYPPYHNTTAEYLQSGEEKFVKLKEELQKAQKYIFLEYFIIEEGEMWGELLDILVEKAATGVEVRVIYDDLGCLDTLPYKYNKKLQRMGIKAAVFNPLMPILSSKYNNRDHRKIAIIDGHTAFTGGVNLADEYINRVEKYGHWKDSAIMIKGEAVWSMTVMFLSMWHYLKGIKDDLEYFKYDTNASIESSKQKDGYIQPFADSPLDDEAVGEVIYLNLINKAEDYIYITTPYLILANEMLTALTSAAKAGVDVRIITPYQADKWYVHLVTRSYYQVLLESGVRIYEYTPGFIHAKNYIVDDKYGVVGTINMDYRSLYLHFECGVWLYDCSTVFEMKDDFFSTLKVAKEITEADLATDEWYKSLGSSILRIFAPLM
ncbi:cardiolipin synthase [Fuchsiella alkaliacetigena]|uniref:cardiolipin synthase n=1 Tax=Fuchsiella alkaliacetigena TaxID=957042 RepID=UPI00200A3F89|nr:cardiolipin synthase [Fuchsiella alkaliacetigena]MCK8825362.1 cardiolipin synthase [Fuchsiella alkaliacetigena]